MKTLLLILALLLPSRHVYDETRVCSFCDGAGYIWWLDYDNFYDYAVDPDSDEPCVDPTCHFCHGNGRVPKKVRLYR